MVSGYDKRPDPWGWREWLELAGVLVVIAGMVSCTWWTHGRAAPVAFTHIHVDDGDTIHLKGDPRGIRLVGFNAPESTKLRAKCEAELRLGVLAKARLKQILERAMAIDLRAVACACRPGTAGTYKCNLGRSCAYLSADGVDVGRT